jgi:magnesium transporter
MPASKHKSGRKKARKARQVGTPPGQLVVDPNVPSARVRLIAFSEKDIIDKEIANLDEIPAAIDKWDVTWVDVVGTQDVRTIEKLGDLLNLHKLALEDVVHGNQRAKTEEYKDTVFVIVKTVTYNENIETDQVGIFLGKKFVVTFHDHATEMLKPVLTRIQNPSGRIRQNPPDYLLYAIMDAVVDSYFPLLESMGEMLDQLEDEVLERPEPGIVSRVHEIKRGLLAFRRAVWPLRDAINLLIRDPSSMISDYTDTYLRDCYDHTARVIELVENYREVTSDLMSVYLSSISNRMNEIMKVLTIIATIFIPLSFIVGLYGMNFNPRISPLNMPELNWYWGYPFVWLVMLLLTGGMLLYFRKRGWV